VKRITGWAATPMLSNRQFTVNRQMARCVPLVRRMPCSNYGLCTQEGPEAAGAESDAITLPDDSGWYTGCTGHTIIFTLSVVFQVGPRCPDQRSMSIMFLEELISSSVSAYDTSRSKNGWPLAIRTVNLLLLMHTKRLWFCQYIFVNPAFTGHLGYAFINQISQ